EAAPVNPEVEQAYCDEDGNPVDPSVELSDTEGIDYTIDGEVKPGETVTVIATPEDGYELTETDGWELQDDGTATQELELEDVDFGASHYSDVEAAPVNPEIEQAYCDEDGNPVDPSVELSDTEGIDYTIDGEV